jgi:hypothetical protein
MEAYGHPLQLDLNVPCMFPEGFLNMGKLYSASTLVLSLVLLAVGMEVHRRLLQLDLNIS